MNNLKRESLLKELNDIKRLLIFQLVTSGISFRDIAKALDVKESVLRKEMKI
jgi:IS30 family transposase